MGTEGPVEGGISENHRILSNEGLTPPPPRSADFSPQQRWNACSRDSSGFHNSREKRIVFLFLTNGAQRSVTWANQSLGWQAKNLLADFLTRQVPGLISAPNRARND